MKNEKEFVFTFRNGVKLVVDVNEVTSSLVMDGYMKGVYQELEKFVALMDKPAIREKAINGIVAERSDNDVVKLTE